MLVFFAFGEVLVIEQNKLDQQTIHQTKPSTNKFT